MATTFPSQPSENQDPWYENITAWMNAAEAAINGRVEQRKGILNSSDNLNDYFHYSQAGNYAVDFSSIPQNMPQGWNQSGVVAVLPGSENAAVAQLVVSDTRFLVREALAASSGTWGDWREGVFYDNIPFSHPSAAILRLAKQDGWTAVYDPTNPLTVDKNAATGNIRRIKDGLGNLPSADAATNATPALGAFGSLDGFRDYSLFIDLTADISAPITYLGLAKTDESYSTVSRVIIGGDTNGKQHRVFLWPETSAFAMADNTSYTSVGKRMNDRPFCYSATFDELETTSSINGQFGMNNASPISGAPVGSIRLGGRSFSNPSKLKGTMGPTLIYVGKLSDEKRSRMERLLMTLAGIPVDPAPIYTGARVYSMDSAGNDEFVFGDPDAVSLNGIMSITKAINALAARRYLSSNALLDQTVTLVEDDFNRTYSTPLEVGDVITYRDLIHCMALPSDNSAPVAIARHIGIDYIPGSKSPRQRYVDVMNDILVTDLGFENAAVFYEGGTSLLSPRQVAKVFKMLTSDTVLRSIFGKLSYTVTIAGTNARTFNIYSTLDQNNYPILGYVAGKSGTGASKRHGVSLWVDPNGEEHITVLLDVDSSTGSSADRYSQLRIARHAILGGLKVDDRSMTEASGSHEPTTYVRNVSQLFAGQESGVYMQRVGLNITTTFQDVVLLGDSFLNVYPPGFRPALPYVYGVVYDDSGVSYRYSVARSSGTLSFLDSVLGKAIRGTISWDASAAASWPTPPYPGEYHTT